MIKQGATRLLLDRLRPHWEPRRFLRAFLRRLDVDAVFDVGANVGQYGSELRLIGYRGLILSFEPDPAAFAILAAQARSDPRWIVVNEALGRSVGLHRLNLMARSDFNSFREPSEARTTQFAELNRRTGIVDVPVNTLDAVFHSLQARHGFARPFLKMDTQGFDLEVFEGAAKVADRLVGLQSEIAVTPIYEGVPDWREALARYERRGFTLAGLHPVDPWSSDLVEFDCFMRGPGHAAGDSEPPRS